MGKIGARIKNNPEKAEEILSEEGLTREEFEKRVRKISEHPELARKYRKSFEKHLNSKEK